MEEKNQRMENENIWGNICKLVRIQLIQQENLLTGGGAGIITYFLVITVFVIAAYYASNNVAYYEIINGYGGIIWISTLCILLPAYQLFTNKAISMYPGNAVTRFLSRIIADHIRLLVYILCIGFSYILQYGLLWLCLQGKPGIDVQIVFDIRYLGAGMLRLGVICMALYGMLALFMALCARLGNRVSIGLFIAILIMVYGCVRYRPKFVMAIWEWGRKLTMNNTDLFSYFSVFVLIWLVCILAAGILACHVRYWRISQQMEYIAGAAVAFLAIGVVFFLAPMIEIEVEVLDDTTLNNEGIDDAMQYDSGDLYCSTLIRLPKNNAFSMDEDMISIVDENSGKKLGDWYNYINNDNNIGFDLAGISEAADLGIPEGVDLSGVDEEHAVLVYQLPNVRINGQEIYRDLMKDMPKYLRQVENQKNIKLEYYGRLQSTICIDCFPSTDRFLYRDSHDMTMAEYYNRIPFLQTTLLLSDDRYKEFEQEMDG